MTHLCSCKMLKDNHLCSTWFLSAVLEVTGNTSFYRELKVLSLQVGLMLARMAFCHFDRAKRVEKSV